MRKTGLCSGCGVVRTSENTDRAGKQGLNHYCKKCKPLHDATVKVRRLKQAQNNPESLEKRSDDALARRREKSRDYSREWRKRKKLEKLTQQIP